MQYFIEIFTPTKFHEILHHYRLLNEPAIRPTSVVRQLNGFWVTVYKIIKTVRLMLPDRCLSVCPVCPVRDVGALWPNGWMD